MKQKSFLVKKFAMIEALQSAMLKAAEELNLKKQLN